MIDEISKKLKVHKVNKEKQQPQSKAVALGTFDFINSTDCLRQELAQPLEDGVLCTLHDADTGSFHLIAGAPDAKTISHRP